jgi:hypothetical protein
MEKIYYKIVISLIVLILITMYYVLTKRINNIENILNNKVEHMTTGEGQLNILDNEALQNVASVYNKKKLVVDELEVTGKVTIGEGLTVGTNLIVGTDVTIGGNTNIATNIGVGGTATIAGLFVAKNGSRFSGDRHLFTDAENAGRLRVGGAWGKPGIFAEDGKSLALGGSSGWVDTMTNSNLHGTLKMQNGFTSDGVSTFNNHINVNSTKYIHHGTFKLGTKNGHYLIAPNGKGGMVVDPSGGVHHTPPGWDLG